ncbi:MAG: hypothetical protein V3V28_00330 [Polaribacter sp.]|uniref:hypothetical protein n=1 Tax=Polaribacter sp. TaxID=1920175 RepID=UPI002F3591DF
MKKCIKITILLFFLVLPSIKAQDLTGRVTYKVSLNLTVEQVKKRNKAIGRKVSQNSIDRINNARDILALLEFNNEHSIQKLGLKNQKAKQSLKKNMMRF